MSNIVNISDVFISYSRKNKEFARKLFEEFKSRDMEVWADWEDIPKGAQWRAEIKAGVQGADAFLFIISPDSVKSEECRKEIELAIEYKKRIVPVLYLDLEKSDFELMHPAIGAHNWIFARDEDSWDDALKTVLDTIKTDLDHVRDHTRLNVRAQEWINNQRNESFLLDGDELEAAEAWLENSAGKFPEPTDLHTAYISISRRMMTRRRNLLIAGTVVSLIILALGILSFVLFQSTQRNLDLAQQRGTEVAERAQESRSLSQASSSQVILANDNVNLALALAMEAVDHFQVGETEYALANAAYAIGSPRMVLEGHEGVVRAVDYHSDGTMVVSAGDDGTIRFWDLATQTEIAQLTDHEAEVNDVVFSADGTMMLSGSADGTMRLWDVETREVLHIYRMPPQTRVRAIAMNTAMTQIVAATGEQGVFLWDIDEDTRPAARFDAQLDHAMSVAFSPDGTWLAAGSEEGDIALWQIEDPEQIMMITGHRGQIHDLAFSPDGQYLVSVSEDDTVRVWYTENGQLKDHMGSTGTLPYGSGRHTDGVLAVDFSADGKYLLTSSWDLSAMYWDFESGHAIDLLAGSSDSVMDVAFSPDGDYGISGAYDGKVTIWNLKYGAEIGLLSENTVSQDIDFSDDGHYVISDGDMVLRDVETGDSVRTFGSGGDARSVEFSPNNQWVVAGFPDGAIRMWDRESGDLLFTLTGNNDIVLDLLFSPDSTQLFSAANDGSLMIWDTATGELVKSLAGHDKRVTSISVSPDGTKLASASYDLNINIWDITTGDLLHVLSGHIDWVNDVAFSPDGTKLVSGSNDLSIRLWDVEAGTQIRKIDGHLGPVVSVAFGPRGRTFMSAGWDNRIQIWSVDSGLKLRRFEGHTDLVNDVEFSPDGKTVVSGGLDGTLRLWHVHTLNELIEWVYKNRYIAPFSCDERAIYRVMPLCEGTTPPPS